ncbi:MAG: aconitate hydratase [Cycloclasticus sp.]|nr:aconitate hydratase [Cycloclasticus sp.]
MIRFLILIGIVFGALYLVRWFLTTPAENVAATIRKSLWLLLGLGLIVLAVSGRLNIIFAFIGSAIPLIARHLPNVLRLLGIVKTIKTAQEKPQKPTPPTSQQMSQKEAQDILGLAADATKEQVSEAHKRLMQKLHPDKGGSAHLASQLNQAKATLLKKT